MIVRAELDPDIDKLKAQVGDLQTKMKEVKIDVQNVKACVNAWAAEVERRLQGCEGSGEFLTELLRLRQ